MKQSFMRRIHRTVRAAAASSMIVLALLACTQKNPLDPYRSLVKEVPLFVDMTATAYRLFTGGQKSDIQVRMVNETGAALSYRTISFGVSTGMGTIMPIQTVTDENGWANATFTSGSTKGRAVVTAKYQTYTVRSVEIDVLEAGTIDTSGVLIQVAAERSEMLANGEDDTVIDISLIALGNAEITGKTIALVTTEGSIPSAVVTGSGGAARAVLTSPASRSDLRATVTASYLGQSANVQVLFKGISFYTEARPLVIYSDGRTIANIRATVKETSTNIGLPNEIVRFGTTLGNVTAESITDESGVATAELLSSTTPGRAEIIARYGRTLLDTVSVEFMESVPTYMEVSASPPVLPADGESQSLIKATISDEKRNPVPDGIPVLFEIANGTGSMERQKATSAGVAMTYLTAGTRPGDVLLRVTAGTLQKEIHVNYVVGEVYNVMVKSDRDSLPADGIQNATIYAQVVDAQGNPVSGKHVVFSASIGDITPTSVTNDTGYAFAYFSSGVVGTATITAAVTKGESGVVSGSKIIRLLPGFSNSIVLRYSPDFIGVKNTGQNQTTTIFADIRDSKNNPVVDGTLVTFQFVGDPLDAVLSTSNPVPTVGGTAQVSLSSGIRAGTVRIQASVTGPGDTEIQAISTKIIIHAGWPYMEDVGDLRTTHLTLAANRLNIWATLDTTLVSVMVVDRYNNPVEKGTAVYFTTSGGGITTVTTPTTVSYTDDYGYATARLTSGNPQPTIDRYYHYTGLQDCNLGSVIPGPIPDFDGGVVLNSEGGYGENDGMSRIIAQTKGHDVEGSEVKVWEWISVVMSHAVTFDITSIDRPGAIPDSDRELYLGESATILFSLMDYQGNPIESDAILQAKVVPDKAQIGTSWQSVNTGDGWGTCYYSITIYNDIDPQNPKPGSAGAAQISWNAAHQFGDATTPTFRVMDTVRP